MSKHLDFMSILDFGLRDLYVKMVEVYTESMKKDTDIKQELLNFFTAPNRIGKKLDDYDKNDKEHQLDHTKLHDFAKPQITVSSGTPDNEVITKELGQDGRDASAVISCLVEVVNDLVSKVEALENA